jgi:OOP family OmpA-OmpF porin
LATKIINSTEGEMKKIMQCLFLAVVGVAFAACTPQIVPQPFSPVDLASLVANGKYQKKVDNFFVIFDASSSMSNSYDGSRKFDQAKVVVDNLNNTLPPLDIQAGIRVFGPRSHSLHDDSSPLYGMIKYSHRGVEDTMAGVTSTAGLTPLAKAFDISTADISKTSGPIAVILISDAEVDGNASVSAARAMKKAYGDRVCIYTILIGNGDGSSAIMEKIAAAGGCGFATDYEALSPPEGMSEFVEKVFLKEAHDSDGDGVYDATDRCPNSPRGAKVDASGCQIKTVVKDSDRDGVLDPADRCPGTPYGIKVDKVGCPLPITTPQTIELQVEFDFDKYSVRSKYHRELENFANFMKSFPALSVTLAGHTDNIGSKLYNQKLSQKRAASVKQYLEVYFGVNPARIKTAAHGFSKPIASNKTADGRQRNRRVYATLSTK